MKGDEDREFMAEITKIHYYMDISRVQASEMRKSSNNYSSKKQSNKFKINKKKYVAAGLVFKGVVV